MNNNINDIEILIGKSISGNATSEEILKLEAWKAASKRNVQIYKETLKAWKNSKIWLSNETIQQDKVNVQLEISKQLFSQVRRIKRQSFIYKIAAIIALPLAFAFSWYFIQNLNNIEQIAQYCEVIAPKGHVSKCILPDGTEVWVNTGSTLTYNTTSFNKKVREIKLEGEAYFQVAKNRQKPFKVITPLADVNVTGTFFNVKAYSGSNVFETVLAEGSVELQLKNACEQTVYMKPGERAIYNLKEKKIKIENVDAELFTSWRNGEIIFKDATLNDLIKELERIYDIRFHLKDKSLGEYRFRGMFSYNNNLIDALEKIRKTARLEYHVKNKEVWLSQK